MAAPESKGRWITPVMLLCAAAFVIASLALLENCDKTRKAQAEFEELRQGMEEVETEAASEKPPLFSKKVWQKRLEPVMLPHMARLYEQNPDIAGWIRVEGTHIDYPVMLTPYEPHKYLQLGFDGQPSASGVPFIGGTSIEDDNLVIHGHNMKNNTMFADLLLYEDADFYQEHKIIYFDTLYEQNQYEVIAAFLSKAYRIDEQGFRYHRYTSFDSQNSFNGFMAEVNQASLYETAATASYGDSLISLSTCAYHVSDGRFAVVARKIKEK